ncbi:hypothetical protein FRX31_002237 [Thalictrum thalictroides]|uniref:Uncharacterized protein n=1 Tax=Thalictrum thalictroides TaxID=46969 RepID=A0A7J6XF61_THATH|nr:hypothetical protein FRX31_002237 [Thalictrum thalictroides]
MAVSAFKSTSKRGNLGNSNKTTSTPLSSSSATSSTSFSKGGNSDNLDKKPLYRRSRSVSATSRIDQSSSFYDFTITRDNPLFCTTSSSTPDVIEANVLVGTAKVDRKSSKFEKSPSKLVDNGARDSTRGRSVARNSDSGNHLVHSRKSMGQSLSRLDTGRRHRSVSRVHREDSEGENEKKFGLSTTLKSKKVVNSSPSVQTRISVNSSDSEQSSRTRSSQTWSSQHPLCEPSDHFYSCSRAADLEDVTSTSSFSEAEEKTIVAFTERMKSFQNDPAEGNNGTGGIYETERSEVRHAITEIQIDLENVIQKKSPLNIGADMPPELVNPDAVELVSEIRNEYAAKLKQSQDRAKKLRADLSVEEHREQEFSRILEDIIPEPKNFQTQKSRPRRKTSIERRRMSKRLAEEAMNYFDECVSISTFDGSDFSSAEDPLSNLAVGDNPVDGHRNLLSTSSSASANYYVTRFLNNNKELDEKSPSMLSHEDSELLATGDSQGLIENPENLADSSTSHSRKFCFSLSHAPEEADVIRHEMGNFIKMFEKKIQNDDRDHRGSMSSYYDGDFSELSFPDERLLFNKVVLRNKIDSGVLLLCDTWR